MVNEKIKELLNKALALPMQPGVYLMVNAAGTVIYVGKAKLLKNRVCSYFREGTDHTPKVAKMVSLVDRFQYIVCDSEFEALVLEASLIKQYQPKYNILLKDDKGYHYIRVSPAPWRRITPVKQTAKDGAVYLGPYYTWSVVEQSVDEACKAFGLPTCTRKFPGDFGKTRPCLNRSLGICTGVCTGKIPLKDHEERVDQALAFLQGDVARVLGELNDKMENAAQALQFEQAARLRDRIRAIEKITNKQKIVDRSMGTQDMIGYAATPEQGCFEVFHFQKGTLTDREHFFVEPDESVRSTFLVQYYGNGRPIPATVTVDELPENAPELTNYLSGLRGKPTRLHQPKRGETYALMKMCVSNAGERLIHVADRQSRERSVLSELAALLGLQQPPHRIECYDISHTAGDQNVAGMTVFIEGKPAKGEYRRFQIKGFDGQDDYGSMREVISRRMNEYQQQKSTGKGFGVLPDLILLDGGQGQVNAVLPLLREMGYTLPVFGMVKDSRHHTRAIVGETGEIQIKANRNVFTFVTKMQDETHRFAITYHRSRSGKKLTRSRLLDIPGIGEKRAAALMKAMGSLSAVEQADEQQLLTVPGMNAASARAVYAYFHGEK